MHSSSPYGNQETGTTSWGTILKGSGSARDVPIRQRIFGFPVSLDRDGEGIALPCAAVCQIAFVKKNVVGDHPALLVSLGQPDRCGLAPCLAVVLQRDAQPLHQAGGPEVLDFTLSIPVTPHPDGHLRRIDGGVDNHP